MSLFDRIRSVIAPCNHAPEIERLTLELQEVALDRDDKARKLDVSIVFIKDLRAQLEEAQRQRNGYSRDIDEYFKPEIARQVDRASSLQVLLDEAKGEIATFNDLYETNYQGRVEAEVALEAVRALLLETNSALEQAQSRVALLENPPQEEQPEFELPTEPPFEPFVELDGVVEATWLIVGLAFDGRRSWFVRRPGEKETLSVTVRDKVFHDRVHTREHIFGDGDMLRTRTHTIVTKIGPDQRKAQHTIVEVLQVINQPPHEQAALSEAAG
jgi:hypothetical protein